ncbi:Cloroperoxidase [Amniculicola lignicola CBS 123094]|uniref:Cloroperoxidase n=1 Tax=Amniculicola lignicola CBS 123094 TaxID=1392246 RepID=A0A6A5WII6_9PLEO|nr:Cloroperoxidase [Amniculicola lignicola CBS 123094]
MKIVFGFLAIVALVSAVNFDEWHPPTNGDARSPCPALNSLANHGLIPRDGKDISAPQVIKGLNEGMNVSMEVATMLARAALGLSSNPSSGKFSLCDLGKHNAIEHDGSLSREDVDIAGGDQKLNPKIFKEYLSYFGGLTELTLPAVAAARWGRVQTSCARNSKFTYGPTQQFNSYLETAIYFRLLSNPATGTTPLEFVKIFFEQERLPAKEGWRPLNPIHALEMSQDALMVALATPEKNPFFNGTENDGGLVGIHF